MENKMKEPRKIIKAKLFFTHTKLQFISTGEKKNLGQTDTRTK